MDFVLQPWQFLLACLAGWINQEQQKVIDYLIAENRILKERFVKKRILLNDEQRLILAVKGKSLGSKVLQEIETVFTPDTILRWYKQLVAQKWDYSDQRKSQVGRPRIRQVIVDLTVRMAKENPDRGKQTKWSSFLKAHWESLGAVDFTTIEVWTKHGLITYYLLFVIKVSSRKVEFVGCTPNPCFFWMEQKAKHLTDPFDIFLRRS